ncbi:uncharacterized protein [Haliotis cracherodii]|uniref:uncharacterized protein n=1 Tax=Haliotis cracherodii TaxID=6455 RepID=UPI0039E76755
MAFPYRKRYILLMLILCFITFIYSHFFLHSSKHKKLMHKNDFQQIMSDDVSYHGESDQSEKILQIAQKITDGPVLITIINDAYLPFTHSWLCNTKYMGIHKQVLIIVTDKLSRDTLTRLWPDIHVFLIPGAEGFSGDQVYSHVGYVRIMIRRTTIILELLKNQVELLLFEVDCLWLTDPIPECQREIRGYDLLATKVSDRPGILGGGFLYMIPNSKVVNLWGMLTQKLMKIEQRILKMDGSVSLSEGDNDQMYLSKLIGRKYGSVEVTAVSLDKFADGRWYKMDEEKKKTLRPLIINNNWVTGNKAKMRRARKFHHWFWKENDEMCDFKLVNSTVY